jgi:UDP-N-acetyl-D-galactosamine dehydrogenase
MPSKLAVIGLGYVGLPLAIAFGSKRTTIGFDVDKDRICSLRRGHDKNNEVSKQHIESAAKLTFSCSVDELRQVECFVIAVPTPVDEECIPDLTLLIEATEMVGSLLTKGAMVIYESTVYPGTIDEVCVPLLQNRSGLRFNVEFFCGYSPERVNPGKSGFPLQSIIKVVSGSNHYAAEYINHLYSEIVDAGTHLVSSMKVAEMAKVIENVQRDVNIALVNEFAQICSLLDLNIGEVLQAAGTKWNFLKFKPGLVGGHCIPVDPYYLDYKAKSLGFTPKLLGVARSINREISNYVGERFVRQLMLKRIDLSKAKVLILGYSYKPNCSDVRNSGVEKLIQYLSKKGLGIDVFDPVAVLNEIPVSVKANFLESIDNCDYDGVILAVDHLEFRALVRADLRSFCKKNSVIYDLTIGADPVVYDAQF